MNDKAQLISIGSTDSDCFACGTDNPCGLHMTFRTDGRQLYGRVCPPGHVRGWRNLMHGGIISTILDETMAWTAIHLLEQFILTKSIQVDFLKPVTVEQELQTTGWIQEQTSQRRATMAASLADSQGTELARASGDFVLFHPESKALQRMMPDEVREELQKRFLSKQNTTPE